MRAIDVVKLMRERGHKITIYKRPDGGIRVTKIDGVKFSSSNSDGINYLREAAHENISEKAYKQRRSNERVAREGKARQKAKMPSLTIRKGDSKATRKNKYRVKRALARARKYRKTKMKQVSQRLKREGYAETIRALENIARKESGLAYPANVDGLGDYVKIVLENVGQTSKGETIANKLYKAREHFMDAYIARCNADLYQLEKIYNDAMAGDGVVNMAEIITIINQLNSHVDLGIIEGEKIYKDVYGK